MFKQTEILFSRHPVLRDLGNTLFTHDQGTIFHHGGQETSRVEMDGIYTVVGLIGRQRVGLVLSDFRVGGASFGKLNSQRVLAFVEYLLSERLPLIMNLNTLGVRFTEGRTIFDSAFSIIPKLFEFRKDNLLITIADGKTLGIGAIFFSQGHYRFATKDGSLLNLTGPEVHKKYFGQTGENFEEYTDAEYQFSKNFLVHELHEDVCTIYPKVRSLIDILYGEGELPDALNSPVLEGEQGALCLADQQNAKLHELLVEIGDKVIEIFPQRSPIVKTFVAQLGDKKYGVLLNPPGHANNMISVNAIEKAVAAMKLFRALQLPVVSILDSPGGDPRQKESDADALMKTTQLAEIMINYPFEKMGILYGRCFGGSGMFAFPKIFGGKKTLAVAGAQIGVMHPSLIRDLLAGTPRLLKLWEESSASERPGLSDLIQNGTVDQVIEKNQIRMELEKFLIKSARYIRILQQMDSANTGTADGK